MIIKFILSSLLIFSIPTFSYGVTPKNTYTPTSAVITRVLENRSQQVRLSDLKNHLQSDPYRNLIKLGHKFYSGNIKVRRAGNIIQLSKDSKKLEVEMVFSNNDILTKINGRTYNLNKPGDFKKVLYDINNSYTKRPARTSGVYTPLSLLSLLFFRTYEAEATSSWFFLGGMAALGIGIAVGLSRLGKSLKNTKHEVVASGEVTSRNSVTVDGDVTANVNANGDRLIDSMDSLKREYRSSRNAVRSDISIPTSKSIE